MDEAKARKFLEPGAPQEFTDLAFHCCKYEAKQRPTFSQIVQGLTALMKMPIKPPPAAKPKIGARRFVRATPKTPPGPNRNNSQPPNRRGSPQAKSSPNPFGVQLRKPKPGARTRTLK